LISKPEQPKASDKVFEKSAFTHPLVKPSSGSIQMGQDRVLIPKDCKCKSCTAARKTA
jgi:hypothetical protein